MSHASALELLVNAAAGNGSDFYWKGGHTAFIGEATFGGGSVKLQIKLPQGNYFDVSGMSLTAAGILFCFLPAGTYRAVGATGSAFYARLASIPY